MAESFAEWLQNARLAHSLSLAQLAARAQVAERTLSYWESGTRQPRLPELESVLNALAASASQRAEALALVDAPRAARHLRLSPDYLRREEALGPLPSGGDLLRALRTRRGLYLEQVAQQMGVAGATLSRWEQGKAAPQGERLQTLLTVLGARSEERKALQEGYLFLMTPLRASALSVSALRDSFHAFMRVHETTPDPRLDDLRFLVFEAQAWTLAAESAHALPLLGTICAHYSAFAAATLRAKEAGQYAWRALDLLSGDAAAKEDLLRAAIIGAQAEVYRGTRSAPQRGLEMLRSWRSADAPPKYEAWLLADTAEYLALQGEWQAAARLHEQACHVAERAADPEQLRFRKIDMAKMAIRAGQAERALSLVSLNANDFPSRRAPIELLFAEALLALEERADAQVWLERARADIISHDLSYLNGRADALAKHF